MNKTLKQNKLLVTISIIFVTIFAGLNAPNISAQDIDSDYSIDQAIDRFGIDEDVTSFIVEKYNGPTFEFQLDEDLQFQLVDEVVE